MVLRDVWGLVAGNRGYLSESEFVSCLYLLDLVRSGRQLPRQIPPGPFPPVVGAVGESEGWVGWRRVGVGVMRVVVLLAGLV